MFLLVILFAIVFVIFFGWAIKNKDNLSPPLAGVASTFSRLASSPDAGFEAIQGIVDGKPVLQPQELEFEGKLGFDLSTSEPFANGNARFHPPAATVFVKRAENLILRCQQSITRFRAMAMGL